MRLDVVAHVLVVTLALVLCSGCLEARSRSFAADAPHVVVPPMVDETLKAGEDPHNRGRVASILETPEMRRAIESVAKTAVAGALDEVSTDESKARVATLTTELTNAMAKALAENVREELSSGDRAALERAVASLAAAGTRAAMRSAADEIPTTVAPAVKDAVVYELNDPQLRGAVSSVVNHTARQAIVETRDAIAEARAQNLAEGKLGPLDRLARILTLSWFMAFVLGIAAVGVLGWGLRQRRRTRRFRSALVEVLAKDEHRTDEDQQAHRQRLVALLQ